MFYQWIEFNIRDGWEACCILGIVDGEKAGCRERGEDFECGW